MNQFVTDHETPLGLPWSRELRAQCPPRLRKDSQQGSATRRRSTSGARETPRSRRGGCAKEGGVPVSSPGPCCDRRGPSALSSGPATLMKEKCRQQPPAAKDHGEKKQWGKCRVADSAEGRWQSTAGCIAFRQPGLGLGHHLRLPAWQRSYSTDDRSIDASTGQGRPQTARKNDSGLAKPRRGETTGGWRPRRGTGLSRPGPTTRRGSGRPQGSPPRRGKKRSGVGAKLRRGRTIRGLGREAPARKDDSGLAKPRRGRACPVPDQRRAADPGDRKGSCGRPQRVAPYGRLWAQQRLQFRHARLRRPPRRRLPVACRLRRPPCRRGLRVVRQEFAGCRIAEPEAVAVRHQVEIQHGAPAAAVGQHWHRRVAPAGVQAPAVDRARQAAERIEQPELAHAEILVQARLSPRRRAARSSARAVPAPGPAPAPATAC